MQKILLLLSITLTLTLYSQEKKPIEVTFGELTDSDLSQSQLDDYSELPALILYESGKNKFEQIGDYVRLVKEVHRKIKVFDSKKFQGTEVKIPFYTTDKSEEKVTNIKAFTHNGIVKSSIKQSELFLTNESANWSSMNFAFPNVKDGSILEYTYRIESPYFFSFGNWEFQGDLPKLYSEFRGDVPGNYIYKRSLIGDRVLDIKSHTVKKNCFFVTNSLEPADCDSFIYAMFDVAPFEEEPFMLSKKNYVSRLDFEFVESIDFQGRKYKYSKTWEDVDKEFRTDKDIGRQIKFSNFFEDRIPANILSISDSKIKAIQIYNFIQNHFQWNGSYKIFSDIRVKDAFSEKSGNIAEINLALINALRAANLDAHIALNSTRSNGLISDLYPTLTGFNYLVAYLKIGGQVYLLDATDKILPFGMVPFKVLNSRVRVMDFKNKSYWHKIVPELRNVNYYKYTLELDSAHVVSGKLKEVHSGYEAYNLRKRLIQNGESTLEKDINGNDIEFSNILFDENKFNNNKPLVINQDLSLTFDEDATVIYLNPLQFHTDFLDNPFSSTQRMYPIDLGYPKTNSYEFNLSIPENYSITSLPDNKKIVLKDGVGVCTIFYKRTENGLHCAVRFKQSSSHFNKNEYTELRSFYNNIVDEHTRALVKIESTKD